MGAWGYNSFENDDAMMWSDDCVSSRHPAAFVERSLTKITSSPDAIDSRRAIAAAELVATARGHRAREFPEDLRVWLDDSNFKPTARMRALATAAVTRIRDESELRELWQGDSAWLQSCRRLLQRLDRPPRIGTRRARALKPEKKDKTKESPASILRYIRENGGFVVLLNRKPNNAGFDRQCLLPKEMLEAIGRLPSLEEVTILGTPRGVNISASWMKPLLNLPNLRRVQFSQCKLGPHHFRVLGEIKNLWLLDVSSCSGVTDRGLEYLSGCSALEILDVGNTSVTSRGIKKLQKRLPRLDDIRD